MKSIIFIISSIIYNIIAIRVNFTNFLTDSPASLTNLFISIGFLGYWLTLIFLYRNSKNFLIYSIVISGLTLITSLFIVLINFFLYSFQFPGLLFLIIIFEVPWYGFKTIFKNNDILNFAILIISVIELTFSLLLINILKKDKDNLANYKNSYYKEK